MAEQNVARGNRFIDVSRTVFLQALRESHADRTLRDNQTLMDKVNEIELNIFREAPCPNGKRHEITMQQVGFPTDPGGCTNQFYYQCRNCNDSYWVRYLD